MEEARLEGTTEWMLSELHQEQEPVLALLQWPPLRQLGQQSRASPEAAQRCPKLKGTSKALMLRQRLPCRA